MNNLSNPFSQFHSACLVRARLGVAFLLLAGMATAAAEMNDLSEWSFHGHGNLDQLPEGEGAVLQEQTDSVGLMLISPKAVEGDVTLSFDFRPENEASVGVAMLNIQFPEEEKSLPEDYDGSSAFWFSGEAPNYFMAFHNAAHDRRPFVVRNPPRETLFEAEEETIAPGQWHTIRASRKENTLIFEVDGTEIYRVEDPDPLENKGYLAFRFRGTEAMPARAVIRNISVSQP